MKTKSDIMEDLLEGVYLLSPNEPITPTGIQRVLSALESKTQKLQKAVGNGNRGITLWSPNLTYSKGDVVVYFKTESKQVSADVGKRTFVFILASTKDENYAVPNYDLVEGIPDFHKTNWNLLNPMSYLLQDLIEMKKVVKEVFQSLLEEHVQGQHSLAGGTKSIDSNLLKADYSNLSTSWDTGKYSLEVLENDDSRGTLVRRTSNGIMKISMKWGLDNKANHEDEGILIQGRRNYYQKSPIWDESDHTIFAKRYMEGGNMFSATVNNLTWSNLRYGTNVFTQEIVFPSPFIDDEYMVFFDSYEYGQFVFGYDKADLAAQTEPTYDAVVSRPMLMNKSSSGFRIVLPIHTYLNSIQKWQVGVPWKNEFRLQVIGRYR